jgi:hypothetical protein
LFIKWSLQQKVIALIVYVDDKLLTGNHDEEIQKLRKFLFYFIANQRSFIKSIGMPPSIQEVYKKQKKKSTRKNQTKLENSTTPKTQELPK